MPDVCGIFGDHRFLMNSVTNLCFTFEGDAFGAGGLPAASAPDLSSLGAAAMTTQAGFNPIGAGFGGTGFGNFGMTQPVMDPNFLDQNLLQQMAATQMFNNAMPFTNPMQATLGPVLSQPNASQDPVVTTTASEIQTAINAAMAIANKAEVSSVSSSFKSAKSSTTEKESSAVTKPKKASAVVHNKTTKRERTPVKDEKKTVKGETAASKESSGAILKETKIVESAQRKQSAKPEKVRNDCGVGLTHQTRSDEASSKEDRSRKDSGVGLSVPDVPSRPQSR